MKLVVNLRTLMTAFMVATIVYAIRSRQPAGKFLSVPYDFRVPTLERVRSRWWNPDDPRLFTPHVFGIGWSANLYQVLAWWRDFSEGGREETPQEPEG